MFVDSGGGGVDGDGGEGSRGRGCGREVKKKVAEEVEGTVEGRWTLVVETVEADLRVGGRERGGRGRRW
ncbi:hypothetical protein AgCh_021135 [Apium graveolens]